MRHGICVPPSDAQRRHTLQTTYAPLLPSLFSLNHYPTATSPLWGFTPNSWNKAALERAVQGITAVLLSLKKKPVIRYEHMSSLAKKLGAEVLVSTLVHLCSSCVTPFFSSIEYSQRLRRSIFA